MPLHPKARMFVNQMAEQRRPAWQDIPIEEARRLFASMKGTFGVGPELPQVENHNFDGVPVRIYRPLTGRPLPVVMYFHGGGFVIGDLDTHDAVCRRLARESGFAVVSVDYRLAPEHRYPAAIEDSYKATRFAAEHAKELNFDASALMVAGDSAGGNLATAVCLKSRDLAGPAIRGQILIYPVIEPVFDTESYQLFASGHGLTLDTMEWFWTQYLHDVESVGGNVAYAIPTRADLSGLPRAHIVVAEYDVLRDEGFGYAAKLTSSGVVTSIKQYDGMLHGFVHFAGFFEDGVHATNEIADVIQQMAG